MPAVQEKPLLRPALGKRRSALRSEAGPLVLIAAYFALVIMFVSPFGNFPLNDDWIYAFAVKHFMQTGQFQFVGPNCTTCVAHVVIGAAVCKLVGFSHEALRFTTLSLAFANTWLVYCLTREFKLRRQPAVFAALVYAANPIFLNLAFSYMTDVSAVTLATLYAWLMVRGIKSRSPWWFGAAALALLAAIAVRQTNIVFVAPNVVLLLFLWARRRHSWTLLTLLCLLPPIWYKFIDGFVPLSTNHPAAHGWYQNHLDSLIHGLFRTPFNSIFELNNYAGKSLMYCGFLLLPFLIPFAICFLELFKSKTRVLSGWWALSTAAVVSAMNELVVRGKGLMPFSQNLLRVPIIGSLSIMGVSIANLDKRWRLVLTHVCGLSAVLLLSLLLSGAQRVGVIIVRLWHIKHHSAIGISTNSDTMNSPVRGKEARAAALLFACVSAVAAFAMVIAQSAINDIDRYYLVLLAPTIVFLSGLWRWFRIRPVWQLSVPLLMALAAYSACAQQDYMSWNRARWQAASTLERQGIQPSQIDGGAEYNLDHNHILYNLRAWGQVRLRQWRWWPVQNERYIISFSPIPGYQQIGSEKYWSALVWGNKEVLILRCLDPNIQPVREHVP